jgi:membrane associated rhomboid family serine protease/tetratricopeptide (TPR) repeat protein
MLGCGDSDWIELRGASRAGEGRMIIPISHEEQQVSRLPWVTIVLVAANVLVFLFTLSTVERQSAETRQRIQEIVRFAIQRPYLRMPEDLSHLVPARKPPRNLSADVIEEEQARLDRLLKDLEASASASVYRTYGYIPAQPHLLALLTSMFMHGGWLHLIGNMLFLWLSGGSLEDRWGRIFFPILYGVSGVVATLTHAALNPGSTIPMVGASGAIAGLMGAFLVRLATTRIRFFFWIFIFRGTFHAPAYIMLPLWLLQQFFMARGGAAGGVAVWAHIGGFVFGAAVAIVVLFSDLETKVLAPAIAKKTTWTASDLLTRALGKLDQGNLDGAIQDLKSILKAKPYDIEALTSLIDAYSRKGEHEAAGKESARLVNAYLKSRDLAGAFAASAEHRRAHPDVPLAIRDQLALATDCEKRSDIHQAADWYQEAISSWPDNPLAPKVMVAYGRLLLQGFQDPREALGILERVKAHPHASREFQQESEQMMAQAREALGMGSEPVQAPSRPTSDPTTPPPPPSFQPPATPTHAIPAPDDTSIQLPPPPPPRVLTAIPMRAVGITARGLTLQDRRGATAQLPWQKVTAVSVASIGLAQTPDDVAGALILDLVMAASPASATDNRIRCIRLSSGELNIPQLQNEPSPLRAFQRLVATILKATGATPHPDRESCLGLRGFPSFSDLAAYEADLLSRTAPVASPESPPPARG